LDDYFHPAQIGAILETDFPEWVQSEFQEFTEACLEEAEDDPDLIVHALGVIARAKNMSPLSRDAGLSREGLYKAFSPEGNPTFSTVAKVAKALGFKPTVKPTV
jgi:probable addiction module antidote protein